MTLEVSNVDKSKDDIKEVHANILDIFVVLEVSILEVSKSAKFVKFENNLVLFSGVKTFSEKKMCQIFS